MGQLLKTYTTVVDGSVFINRVFDNTFYAVIPGFCYTERGPIHIDKIVVTAVQDGSQLSSLYENEVYRFGKSKSNPTMENRYSAVDPDHIELSFPYSLTIDEDSQNQNLQQLPFKYFYDNVTSEGLHILTPYLGTRYISEDNNVEEHDGLFFFELKSLYKLVTFTIKYYTYVGSTPCLNQPYPEDGDYLMIKQDTVEYSPNEIFDSSNVVPADHVQQYLYTDKLSDYNFDVKLNKILTYDSDLKVYSSYDDSRKEYRNSTISTATGDQCFNKLRRYVYPFWSVRHYDVDGATEWGAMYEEDLVLHSAVYNDYILSTHRQGKTKTNSVDVANWIKNPRRKQAFDIQRANLDNLKLFGTISFDEMPEYGLFRPNAVNEASRGTSTSDTYRWAPEFLFHERYDSRTNESSIDTGVEGGEKGHFRYTYIEGSNDIYQKQFGESFDSDKNRYSAQRVHFTTNPQYDNQWVERNNEYGLAHGTTTDLDRWRCFQDFMGELQYPNAVSSSSNDCNLNTNYQARLKIAEFPYSLDYLYANRPTVRLNNVSDASSIVAQSIWDHKEKSGTFKIEIDQTIDNGCDPLIPIQPIIEDYGSNRDQNQSPIKKLNNSNYILKPGYSKEFEIGQKLDITIDHKINISIPKNYRLGDWAKAACFIPNATMLVDLCRSNLHYENVSDYSVIPYFQSDYGYAESDAQELVESNVIGNDGVEDTENLCVNGEASTSIPYNSSFLQNENCWGSLTPRITVRHKGLKANTIYAFHINYICEAKSVYKIGLNATTGYAESLDDGADVIIFQTGTNDIAAGDFTLTFYYNGQLPKGYIKNFGIYEVTKNTENLGFDSLNQINPLISGDCKDVIFPTTFCYLEDTGCYDIDYFAAALPDKPIRRVGCFYTVLNGTSGQIARDYLGYHKQWQYMESNPQIRKLH